MQIQRKDWSADWITTGGGTKDPAVIFRKQFRTEDKVRQGTLCISALGVYEAELNGERIGEYVLAPGWTAYGKRLQYQVYDITGWIREENEIQVTVGKGWMRSPMPGWVESESKKKRLMIPDGLLAEIHLTCEDGSTKILRTDESWDWAESPVRFSEIYDGEIYDAAWRAEKWLPAKSLDWSKEILIPQEGEEIREMERVAARKIIRTPKGETVVDFGQEITGYVEVSLDAKPGETVRFHHGEVLDRDGNFYCANYRGAKAEVCYTCREGKQTWHPRLTFFGFRYIRLLDFPGEPAAEQFTGIQVRSAVRQTGQIRCSHPKLNQLFSNIFWSQRDNFLDVPTDCPQRDERLGWTGDAQVFVKAASYNFDVEKFFRKWLHDLAADQRENGAVGQVIPDYLPEEPPSAAWGDAAVICPWQIYMTYGNPEVLADQFESMKKWVDYITDTTTTEYLWTGAPHCFGDWLGLDAPSGSYKGSSREELICSAFYAYSSGLLVKAGKVLGKDMTAYEKLHENIRSAFQKAYPILKTQTEHVLALQFSLTDHPQQVADALAALVRKDGVQLKTGFVGTPYILHVLTDYGYADLAYDLFLREDYPSWLYPVNQGATTIWEHWDGIMEDGSFWSTNMNSFNHYAYGSVADWVYEKAAGICPLEEAPGFSRVRIAPHADPRLEWLEAEIDSRHGKIRSGWNWKDGMVCYNIHTPVPAEIRIGDLVKTVEAGDYIFWK